MILSIDQIHELSNIISRNQAMTIGREFGVDYLTEYDKILLKRYGVDVETLYNENADTLFTSFHFGLLADSLAQIGEVENITYQDLFDYISNGDYIPLTQQELATLNSIKTQSLASLKGINNRIFQDINNVLQDSSRKAQEEFIRNEIERGVRNKQTTREIANEIAHKTGDWSRDFDRIVQYTSQTAYEHGKAAAIQRQYGEDVYVYKKVYQGACKHCIRLYLTKGLGSEPKIFKLSQLIANGSNIGRKVADWLPTLDPIHPYCRCNLVYLSINQDYTWNKEKKDFDFDRTSEKPIRPRPKIKAIVGGKEVYV